MSCSHFSVPLLKKVHQVLPMINFGVLGCAEIARKISRAINLVPNTNLHAVASRSIEKARGFALLNGLNPSTTKLYGDYEALLNDPNVDAVYMPLPTSLHVPWAVLAAEKKKHLLLEKPVAMNASDFDKIIEACERNGVQFMDGSMWLHHPRTHRMRGFLSDPQSFGELRYVHSVMSIAASPSFLQNDIRVSAELDGLGALGTAGWYCIGSILWAADYQLPKTVVAFPGTVLNDSGVILSCGASLQWEDGRTATFHCSFLSNLTMNMTAIGTKGTLSLDDFVLPFEETSASFAFASRTRFHELSTGWGPVPSNHNVATDCEDDRSLSQEARMVMQFSSLVRGIKESGSKPATKWPSISRKTQLVLDAVMSSISMGSTPVVTS